MKRIPENDLHSLTSALTHLENFVFLESSKVSENDHFNPVATGFCQCGRANQQ
jgi:hypothetical protein